MTTKRQTKGSNRTNSQDILFKQWNVKQLLAGVSECSRKHTYTHDNIVVRLLTCSHTLPVMFTSGPGCASTTPRLIVALATLTPLILNEEMETKLNQLSCCGTCGLFDQELDIILSVKCELVRDISMELVRVVHMLSKLLLKGGRALGSGWD